jgi:hypothetical protein
MNMVQAAINQPINMIAMRHRFVAAARTVDMAAHQAGGAAIGIVGGNRDHMFIHMIAVRVMQMPIVQIIDMAIVAHGGVAAAGAVNMVVLVVVMAGHRRNFPERAGQAGGWRPTRSRMMPAATLPRQVNKQTDSGAT